MDLMFADVDIVDESAPPPASFHYDGLGERFTPVCTPSRNRKDLLGKIQNLLKPFKVTFLILCLLQIVRRGSGTQSGTRMRSPPSSQRTCRCMSESQLVKLYKYHLKLISKLHIMISKMISPIKFIKK